MQSTFFCPCSYTDTHPCGEKHETWQCGVGLADPSCPSHMFSGASSCLFGFLLLARLCCYGLVELGSLTRWTTPSCSSFCIFVLLDCKWGIEHVRRDGMCWCSSCLWKRDSPVSTFQRIYAGECNRIDRYARAHRQWNDQPQWEMCQKTSERCLLDPSNTSNPTAFKESDCLQGSVPPHYVCLFLLITRCFIFTV